MSQRTVISQVAEIGKEGDNTMFFPQNRTLYADQFTGYAPDTNEEFSVFSPRTIDEVFEHYRPGKEGIFLSDENGESRYENFVFGSIKDFEDDGLISQSEILSDGVYKKDTYYSIIHNVERNRELKRLLGDKDAKKALRNAFKAIRNELKDIPKE